MDDAETTLSGSALHGGDGNRKGSAASRYSLKDGTTRWLVAVDGSG